MYEKPKKIMTISDIRDNLINKYSLEMNEFGYGRPDSNLNVNFDVLEKLVTFTTGGDSVEEFLSLRELDDVPEVELTYFSEKQQFVKKNHFKQFIKESEYIFKNAYTFNNDKNNDGKNSNLVDDFPVLKDGLFIDAKIPIETFSDVVDEYIKSH